MKKRMFNDACHLTEMVLDGTKTQTRRIIGNSALFSYPTDGKDVVRVDMNKAPYKVGEVVAIAQSYETLANGGYLKDMTVETDKGIGFDFKPEYRGAGWRNKMFVKAELMPHHIKVKAIRAERLQDISDEDCMKEGILKTYHAAGGFFAYHHRGSDLIYSSPRDAFSSLIDFTCGKGTWDRNPWVWVIDFDVIEYTFSLIGRVP